MRVVEDDLRRASLVGEGGGLRRGLVGLTRWGGERFAELPAAWRQAVVATVVLRLALAVASFAFAGLLEDLNPVDVDPVYGTGFEGWRAHDSEDQGTGVVGAGLERFDALWYLAIAEHGYPGRTVIGRVPGAAAFFPLFPLLVGGLGRLFAGSFLFAASLVAFAATVAGFAGVHRLVEQETGDGQLARRALVATAVFPSAFFLLSPFTESLFLATSAWALVWARGVADGGRGQHEWATWTSAAPTRRGHWGRAGGFAAAAAVTRNAGVLLVLPLAIMALKQGRRAGIRGWAAALVGAPAGLATYLAFAWWRWGTPLGPLSAQTVWERQWTWPIVTLRRAWRFGTDTPGLYPSGYHSVDVLIAIPIIAAVVWLLVRTPLPYGVYAAAHVLLWLVYPFPGRPLMSTYRFALAVAPLPWAFGAWTQHKAVATVWIAASGALMGVMLLLFVSWYYVF